MDKAQLFLNVLLAAMYQKGVSVPQEILDQYFAGLQELESISEFARDPLSERAEVAVALMREVIMPLLTGDPERGIPRIVNPGDFETAMAAASMTVEDGSAIVRVEEEFQEGDEGWEEE